MALQTSAAAYEKEIRSLEHQLSSFTVDTLYSLDDITTRLDAHRVDLANVRRSIETKTQALGVDGNRDLRRLINSLYLQKRVNARALKMRLHHKLCDRKYEIERLERSYRNTVNGA